jgi:hypothetical protein
MRWLILIGACLLSLGNLAEPSSITTLSDLPTKPNGLYKVNNVTCYSSDKFSGVGTLIDTNTSRVEVSMNIECYGSVGTATLYKNQGENTQLISFKAISNPHVPITQSIVNYPDGVYIKITKTTPLNQ